MMYLQDVWYPNPDSNRDAEAVDFESTVSTIPPSGQCLVGHNGIDPLYLGCRPSALPLS